MNALGERLKQLRGNRSLREVERLTGVSHTYLSTLEKGFDPRNRKERNPTLRVLSALANAYEISLVELLQLTELNDKKREL